LGAPESGGVAATVCRIDAIFSYSKVETTLFSQKVE